MITFDRVVTLMVVCCALTLFTGCQKSSAPGVPGGQTVVAGTVELEVVFKPERENLQVVVPCSADSTVFSILQRAENMGDLKFESIGLSDEMKFVTSIDGIDNQAGSGDNWVYRVNGKLGDKSSGVYDVHPGDQIQWTFGKYDENGS